MVNLPVIQCCHITRSLVGWLSEDADSTTIQARPSLKSIPSHLPSPPSSASTDRDESSHFLIISDLQLVTSIRHKHHYRHFLSCFFVAKLVLSFLLPSLTTSFTSICFIVGSSSFRLRNISSHFPLQVTTDQVENYKQIEML